jgi:hypothetical protein
MPYRSLQSSVYAYQSYRAYPTYVRMPKLQSQTVFLMSPQCKQWTPRQFGGHYNIYKDPRLRLGFQHLKSFLPSVTA